MKFTEQEIVARWSDGKPLLVNGIPHRVGRMSYGDYFLEPGQTAQRNRGLSQKNIVVRKA